MKKLSDMDDFMCLKGKPPLWMCHAVVYGSLYDCVVKCFISSVAWLHESVLHSNGVVIFNRLAVEYEFNLVGGLYEGNGCFALHIGILGGKCDPVDVVGDGVGAVGFNGHEFSFSM